MAEIIAHLGRSLGSTRDRRRIRGPVPSVPSWTSTPTGEGQVYGWDKLVLLKHLLEQGLSKTAIAVRAGVSRGLIYHLLRTGQLERDLTVPRLGRTRLPGRQRLDPYKPIIETRLATYPALSAVRLFAECRAAGYPGSYTQLRVYVRGVRPAPLPDPVVRFETTPGQQAQVDFAEVRLPWGKRYALLIVLGYSRLLWVGFYPRQTMQALMHGLEAAFTQWGGVPRELLFDQLKAVVIGDERPAGGALLANPEFLRFVRTGAFGSGPAGRTARKPRARSNGRSAICATISSTAASFSATPISRRSVTPGSPTSPMSASTARPGRFPPSGSSPTTSPPWAPGPCGGIRA